MNRRNLLSGLAATSLAWTPWAARAAEVIDLVWGDLIPDGETGTLMETLRMNVVRHGELTTGFTQEEARAVTEEFNGQTVRLPGFVVPLDFEADGVKAFILAPFVGACIHVPPPPANQLVLVKTDQPFEFEGLYDPVSVTGAFKTIATDTGLAEIGYFMSATRIEPYEM